MLRKIFTSAAIFITCTALAHATSQNIGVVDMDRIMSESLAAKKIQTVLEQQNTKYQNELKTYETKIMGMYKEINENPNKLSASKLDQLKKDLEAQENDAQKLLQKRRLSLENAMGKAMEKIKTELFGINKVIAQENDLSLMLPSSETLYSDAKIDYTNKVLEQLNTKLPTIDVKFEE